MTAFVAGWLLLIGAVPAAVAVATPIWTTGSVDVVAAPGTAPSSVEPRPQLEKSRRAYADARARTTLLREQGARLGAVAASAGVRASELVADLDDDAGGLRDVLAVLAGGGDSDLDRAADAVEDAEHAQGLADMVRSALAEAVTATRLARTRRDKAVRELRNATTSFTARQVADDAIRRSQFTRAYDVRDRAQDRRNRGALSAWHRYLDDLAESVIIPPPAKQLSDPKNLRARLEPVRDGRGTMVPGVAAVAPPGLAPVTVLARETVAAVSEAFRRVGVPTPLSSRASATAYACDGLVAHVWAGRWDVAREVQIRSVQIGDVVMLVDTADSAAQRAVYVARNRVIVVDPQTGAAGVRPVRRRLVLGVSRPTLRAQDAQDRAPSACAGGPPSGDGSAPTGAGPLEVPLPWGTYALSAGFGTLGLLWASGQHTGADLSAAAGTPVVAAADGVVAIEHPDWAGNLVRIDHGGGVETWYAHLSTFDVLPGQLVSRGAVLGTVGSRGNSTGTHLHFEVRLDGSPVDPASVLDLPGEIQASHSNGEVPSGVHCPATPDGIQWLRCDAAVAYRLMSAAFEEQNGEALCITDSYRSRDAQEEVFQAKPGLAATPGTSVHGVGAAIDLCGGVEQFDTPRHLWMLTRAPAFGWHAPGWAAAGGSRPEPWHFEYASAASADS